MSAVAIRDFLTRLGYTGRYGHDDFPDPGDLVRFFREKRGKSQEWLAQKLGCSRVMVTRMENEGLGMDNIYTRREVAKYLGISPALFGLVSKDDLDTKILYDTTILRTLLQLHREVYFSSTPIGGTPQVDEVISRVSKISEELNHKNRDVLEILCQYYQLGIDIAREEQNYTAVAAYAVEALALANKLEDPVLSVTTLLRLSDTFYEAGDFTTAKQYADMGLTEIRPKEKTVFDSRPKVPSQVVGSLFTSVGKAYAALGLADDAKKYLKGATTVARRKTKEEDVGFVRLSLGICLTRTAYALIHQQKYEAALETLEEADTQTAPTFIRRKCGIQAYMARVYLNQREFEGAAVVASGALTLATTIRAFPNIAHVAAMHTVLSDQWGASDSVIDLGDALKTATSGKALVLPPLV